jgi:hypothetical protein
MILIAIKKLIKININYSIYKIINNLLHINNIMICAKNYYSIKINIFYKLIKYKNLNSKSNYKEKWSLIFKKKILN